MKSAASLRPKPLVSTSRNPDGLEESSTDRNLQKVSSSAHDESSSSGLGLVQFSLVANSVFVPTAADVGSKGVQFDDGGDSHCSLEAPVGAQLVMDKSSCDLDQIDGSLDGVHSIEDCLAYGVDDSTPGSIARLSRKYSLDDSVPVVPVTVSSRGSLEGGQQGVA
ncbi:hypothetical protein Nepgr_006634 [Nepenthes gracilis]|uniref:Uncharacterized protein n=1 Tax=Nepenthes gracilis TaxID=150966 RepID=A0AAD3S5R6_NEPGR|nr:hypothetical protein Nepgr_006634 [Nepenthes gracilis]